MKCERCIHETVCEKKTCYECQSSYCDECGICALYDGAVSEERIKFCKDFVDKNGVTGLKHGYWIKTYVTLDWGDDASDTVYKCSECKEDSLNESRYCPKCGAKMDRPNPC